MSLDDTFWVLSEIPEATSSILNHTTLQFLNKHASAIESLHVSDQYTGFVQERSAYVAFYRVSMPGCHGSLSLLYIVKTLRLWWSDNHRREYR